MGKDSSPSPLRKALLDLINMTGEESQALVDGNPQLAKAIATKFEEEYQKISKRMQKAEVKEKGIVGVGGAKRKEVALLSKGPGVSHGRSIS